MKKIVKRMAKFIHSSLSVVIALSMMLSICAISGFSVMAAQLREVYVYSPSRTPYVHAWASEGDLTGGWTGCAASSAGVSGWYKKTFSTSNSYGLIVHNNAGNQWNVYSSTTGTTTIEVLNYNGSTGGSNYSNTTYSLRGSFDNWSADFSMTTFDTSKVAYKYTKSVSAGTYQFRVHTGDTWYASSFDNSRGNLALSNNGDNLQFTASSSGNVTIYYDPGNGKMFADFSTESGGGGESGGGNDDPVVDNTGMSNAAFTANITLYDYLDDQELSSGQWGNVKVCGNSNTQWFPFRKFNEKISAYYSEKASSEIPLYFGNLTPGGFSYYENGSNYWRVEDGQYGTLNRKGAFDSAIYGLSNYKYAPNNSVGAWGYHEGVEEGKDGETQANGALYQGWYRYNYDPIDYKISYQGLVEDSLSSNGNIKVGSVEAPYFNEDFLSQKVDNNTLGKKVSTQLPFRTKTYDGVEYYEYTSGIASTDSNGNAIHGSTQDIFWLSNNGNNASTTLSSAQVSQNSIATQNLQPNYSTDQSKGIKDGLNYFESGDANSYGFFPFNNSTQQSNNNKDKLDYGFGMKLETKFTVPSSGQINNKDVIFKFIGDDDVWVFIDGKLVLDLGGAHKDAEGTINFRTKTVSTSLATGGANTKNSPAAVNNACSARLAEVMNGSDAGTVHTFTMFYMERGLIESNLSVRFNFIPATTGLTVRDEVNVANVNSGIQKKIAKLDTFEIKSTDTLADDVVKAQSYSATLNDNLSPVYSDAVNSTVSNSSATKVDYDLTSHDYFVLNDPYEIGYYPTYKQTYSSNLSYSTTATVTDDDNPNGVVPVTLTNSNNDVKFLYKYTTTQNVTEFTETNLTLKYVNTPNVGDLSVGKSVVDNNGNAVTDTTDSFSFKVLLDVDGNGTAHTYEADYENGGLSYDVYNSATNSIVYSGVKTDTSGNFTLKAGQYAKFTNIPVGVNYQITETLADGSDYVVQQPVSGVTSGTISGSTRTVSFVNKKLDKSAATVTVSASKTLDGNVPNVDTFIFALTECQISGGNLVKKSNGVTKTANNDGGTVTFDALSYEYQAGTSVEKFYYVIEETALDTDAYIYDDTKYYAVVSVDRTTTPNTASVKYYSTESGAINSTSIYEINASDLKFENDYRLGGVNVNKTDGNGNPIGDSVKFKLYKTTGNEGVLNEANLVSDEKIVDSNGKVTFTDLPIYTGQLDGTDLSTPQWYCLVETETKDGYIIEGAKRYFTIPLSKALDNQNSTTYDFISGGVKYNYVLENGSKVYEFTCDVDNFPVFSPDASGTGMKIFFYLGFGIIATATLLAVSYTVYDKAERKKRKERHARVN